MCLIRKALLGVMVVGGSVAGVGCQRVGPPPSMLINDTPIVIDEAMQRRDWPQTTAEYANGVTVARPTGVYWEPDPELPQTARAAIETPLFLAHSLLLPFDMIWDPFWEEVAYPRAQAPASYTAAPPSDREY